MFSVNLFQTKKLGYIFNSVRKISALYITGDKAKENYVTLQPYLDFRETFKELEALQDSIAKRKSNINVQEVLNKYKTYETYQNNLRNLEKEREAISQKLKANNLIGNKEIDELKTRGKNVRNQVKSLKQDMYPIEDDFIHNFLNLPNKLHAECPYNQNEKLLYRNKVPNDPSQETNSHITRKDLIHFVDETCYYLLSDAAHFDINSFQALTRYFVTKDFIQIDNPDFVRAVLLEANATVLTQYHVVEEQQLQNKLNVAYLTGGGAFESFLGALTKLCVYPSVLPLRFVSCGRSYSKANNNKGIISEKNLFTATQSNTVQTLVATQTELEANEQMENILHLAVDFYKELGIIFRIVYADASTLTPAEALRANIEVYSEAMQTYIVVGHISHYRDFVSKRILFTMQDKKTKHFLHLVGGPVLYTTRLLAALIESGISLKDCKLKGAVVDEQMKSTQNAIDDFKKIFV